MCSWVGRLNLATLTMGFELLSWLHPFSDYDCQVHFSADAVATGCEAEESKQKKARKREEVVQLSLIR